MSDITCQKVVLKYHQICVYFLVKLFDFLLTYGFVVQEETFEEMLNRQKAELNALMEAHRKQQLEYMGKYKRQKDGENR